MAGYAWASHRVLPLDGDDLAVLADGSSGWCVLTRDAYRQLRAELPLELDDSIQLQPLTQLWESALLTRDGRCIDTAQYRQAQSPTAVLLKLTGTCNIDCDYCYDYDAERFRAQQSLGTIQTTLAPLLERGEPLSIAFHGGEPLLRFGLIRQVVQWLEPHRARVGFSLQTNGTRFTPEILDFLEQHDFSVGLSLDGLDEASNALRRTRGPRTPLQCILALMRERPQFVRQRYGFLAVASRTSAPGLPAFARWLQDFGVQGMSITFLDLAGRGADLADERLSPEQAVDLYAGLLEMIRNGQLHSLALRNLVARMNNLFTLQSRDLCYRGPCGAAGDFLVLDAQGGKRTCDCVYHPYFELKAGQDGGDAPARAAIVARHSWLRLHGQGCSRCALFGLCGGTCVAKALVRTGHDRSVDPVECALSRYLYPELLREFTAAERPLFAYYARHAQGDALAEAA